MKRKRETPTTAADKAACCAIEETEVIRLSIEGQRQIAAAILNPPAATPALKRAAKRYRELFGVNHATGA